MNKKAANRLKKCHRNVKGLLQQMNGNAEQALRNIKNGEYVPVSEARTLLHWAAQLIEVTAEIDSIRRVELGEYCFKCIESIRVCKRGFITNDNECNFFKED